MKKYKLISLLTICILFIIFVFQNSNVIRTRFLIFEWDMPKALLISICVLIGIILGIIATIKR